MNKVQIVVSTGAEVNVDLTVFGVDNIADATAQIANALNLDKETVESINSGQTAVLKNDEPIEDLETTGIENGDKIEYVGTTGTKG